MRGTSVLGLLATKHRGKNSPRSHICITLAHSMPPLFFLFPSFLYLESMSVGSDGRDFLVRELELGKPFRVGLSDDVVESDVIVLDLGLLGTREKQIHRRVVEVGQENSLKVSSSDDSTQTYVRPCHFADEVDSETLMKF